ncbi:MAG: J domain-containing protein [Spirochaetota bacterium]
MRSYWGTLAGLLLGLLGGLYGALFGAFIGYLIDLVTAEVRAHRSAVRFLESGRARESFPVVVALAGNLLGHLRGRADALGGDEIESLATRLRPHYPDRFARRLVERMLVAAASHEWIGSERFALLAKRVAHTENREQLVGAVWETLRTTGQARRAREAMHEVARAVGLGEQYIARRLVSGELRDAEACDVLDVPRDATDAEVRTAYRRLAAQFHPDTAASLGDDQRLASEQAFKRIQAAYAKLRDEPTD